MPVVEVPRESIKITPAVRGLCVKPYALHPRGCPNFGKKHGCPPSAPMLDAVFDLTQPCYIIYNVFDFGAHVAKMRAAHPAWSDRQVECCLYWQTKARARLQDEIVEFYRHYPNHRVAKCPEAMGLNVTSTMAALGIDLEWPPRTRAIQVAFAGLPPEFRLF